jgi:hypothetical protein
MGEKVVQHARGVILNESDNWAVVAWPFNKFFNYGEGHAHQIDWSKALVQEKADGSLAIVYFYDGRWHMATSGTPDASGEVGGSGISFADYFWSAFDGYNACALLRSNKVDPDITFCFELIGPLNRVVVVHSTPGVILLGARNRITGQEYSASEANKLFFHDTAVAVREFALSSIEEILASFETISPLSQEGYVVFDGEGRAKFKHPGYVALHHAKDGMTNKAFVEIVRRGEVSEVLVAFPEFQPLMEEAQRRYSAFLVQVEADYERLKEIPVQKAFAEEALKTRCSGALFAVRSKKAPSCKAFLQNMQIDKLLEYLGY